MKLTQRFKCFWGKHEWEAYNEISFFVTFVWPKHFCKHCRVIK